jgi:hypothetical protein
MKQQLNEIKRMQLLAGLITESQLSEEDEESQLVLDAKSIIPDLNELGFGVKLVVNRKEQSEVGKGSYCYISVDDNNDRIDIGLDKGAPLFKESGGGQKLQSLLKDKLASKYDAKFGQQGGNFTVELKAIK